MKKSNKYLKLISCLALCMVLIASMFLTACGEDSAPGSGNIDISKLTKNKTESTTNIVTEVPTEVTTEAEITEHAETEKPTEEENQTEEPKDNTIKKYESNDITITPISQYETKRRLGFFSSDAKKITVTCFLVSGKGLKQIAKASTNIITQNSVKSNESGEYDRCLFIGQYIKSDNKDNPYYAMGEYELKSSDKEKSYILVIEMEKDLFKLSDFKYIFKINDDDFYKDLSFDKNKTDVLKPYIKDDNISRKDVFINENDYYYVCGLGNYSAGVSTVGDKVFSTASVLLTLIPLTNDKTIDLSYNYDGTEDFSNVSIENNVKSNGGINEYYFNSKVEKDLFKGSLAKETLNCSISIKSSGAKIIP